jgi:hypothetical protein
MKLPVHKPARLFLLLVFLFPFVSRGQDLTGIWKGTFTTDGGESYRLEFQIAQNRDKTVTGVSYSYGESVRFYGKATMTGRYTQPTKSFLIQETKTVEVKSASGGTCIMNYRFVYSRSGNEEYLEGSYLGKSEDRRNPANNGVWGDCGAGRVFLRRVQNSDFYIEPFLRNKPGFKTVDTAVAAPPVKPPVVQTPKPQQRQSTARQNPPATRTNTPTRRPTAPPVVTKPVDTVRHNPPVVITRTPTEQPKINIPVTTRSRKNELTQSLTVTSSEITVRLYDNGEVDGDSISVYLDGKAIVSNKGLSTVPITITVKLDENNPEHTLVMVAENMGRIPPNTSLMIVQDGDKRFQVSITSTEQKNAMVRFHYEKPNE